MFVRDLKDIGLQKNRIKIILFAILLAGAVVIFRLFYLQVIRHSFYEKIASSQHWVNDQIPAKRGKIFVKDNTSGGTASPSSSQGGLYPLAANQTLDVVSAAPEEMKDKGDVAKRLAPLVGIEEAKLKELFDNNHTYVPIKHQLTFEESKKITEANIEGVNVRPEQWRYWPEGSLASQLLGYVDTEGNGKYGLEQYFDEELSGSPGRYKAEIDNKGTKIAFGKNVLIPPKDGTDLVLTINRDVQLEAEKIVKRSVEKYKAANGSLVIMNPDNGEIIAMSNYPTYDPSKYKDIKDYSVFRNSSITDEYEPGSIFKVITMAAGLDTKKVEPDTKYNDTGVVVLNGYKIMNSTKKAWGMQNMTFVIQESLNTGVVFVLEQIGKDTFYDYLKRFGFGILTGIEQPSEATGKIYAPSETNDHGYATMTFGQGISTTPIQMITSFAAVANGGKLVKPHLVAEKQKADGKKEVIDSRPIKEIITGEAAAKMRQMMVNQVEKGHGNQAKVKGYKVAGKTGTAQVPSPKGGYDPTKNIGSFIGFGPADSPRFVVLAKIDYPKGIPWAESSAAPMVGQMLDFLFKYYQIPPTEAVK